MRRVSGRWLVHSATGGVGCESWCSLGVRVWMRCRRRRKVGRSEASAGRAGDAVRRGADTKPSTGDDLPGVLRATSLLLKRVKQPLVLYLQNSNADYIPSEHPVALKFPSPRPETLLSPVRHPFADVRLVASAPPRRCSSTRADDQDRALGWLLLAGWYGFLWTSNLPLGRSCRPRGGGIVECGCDAR